MKLKQLHYLFILFSLLGRYNSFAQVVFEKRIPDAIASNGRCVLPTDDGGYFVTGETNSKGKGKYDVYLIKLNAAGDTLWTKTYGGPQDDKGKVILKTKDNNYMIIGSTSSYGPGAPSYYNFYFIKINASGDTLFTRTYSYNKNANDVVVSAIETSDKGFLVVGNAWVYGGYNVGMVVKTDSMGTYKWQGTIYSSANSYVNSCIETDSGDYLVVGSSIGTGSFDVTIYHYSSTGTFIEEKDYDNAGNAEGGGKILKWPGGGYVIGAISGSYYGYSGYFLKLNNKLVKERAKVVSQLQSSRIDNDLYDFFITPDTNIAATGYVSNGDVSLRIAKLDSSFTFKWSMDFGLPNQGDFGYSIKPTMDGAFIVAGTANYSLDTDGDVYVIKVLDNKCKIPDAPVVTSSATGSICAGKPVTFSISSGNLNGGTVWKWYMSGCGGTSVGTGNSITVNPTSTVYYYARGEGGCVVYSPCGSNGVTVNNLPSVFAGLDKSVCIDSYVSLKGIGAKTYTWDNGISNGSLFQPTTTKTYTVTGTDANGCQNTDQVVVTVNPLPTVNAGPDVSTCTGSFVTLNGSGATTYSWSNGVSDGVAFQPASTITYTVIGTDQNGCQNSDQVIVAVNPLPTVSGGSDVTICNGESVTLNGKGAKTYTWDNNVINGQAFFPTTTQSYTVTGKDANNCTNTSQVTITVNVCSGIMKQSLQSFSLYPNPSLGIIQINTNENFNRIVIYNKEGKLMVNESFSEVNSRTYSINLPVGTYELLLYKDSELIGREKLVKQ